jgi:hypothetical protein
MTPSEIENTARLRYNAVGDSFYSQSEIFDMIYAASLELAMEAECIKAIQTTTTVASQQEYAKPTNCISVKRVTYNGYKLQPMDMRDDDALTIYNQATTSTGSPTHYFEWGSSIFLRAIPNDTQTLKIFTINIPSAVSSSSTLDVPARYHMWIVDYLLAMMFAKDSNRAMSAYHLDLWNGGDGKGGHVGRARALERRALRRDSAAFVKDDEELPLTVLGTI